MLRARTLKFTVNRFSCNETSRGSSGELTSDGRITN
jgi:hypothetical protein